MAGGGVDVFGLLSETRAESDLGTLFEPMLSQVECRSEQSDRVEYMVKRDSGATQTGTATRTDTVLEEIDAARSARVGTPEDRMWLTRDHLPVCLRVYNHVDDFFQTPLYHLWHPAHALAEESHHGPENAKSVVDLALDLHSKMGTVYTYGFASYEQNPLADPDLHPDQESLRDGEVPDLHWLNVFPPSIVERFGRDVLLDAPAYRVEELADGSVLLVVQESPVEQDEDRWLVVQDHLGMLD